MLWNQHRALETLGQNLKYLFCSACSATAWFMILFTMISFMQPTQWVHVDLATALRTSAKIAQAMQYLSLPEPRDPDCRLLDHVKIVLGTAHCEALSRFNKKLDAEI